MKQLKDILSKNAYDLVHRRFTNLSRFTDLDFEVGSIDENKKEIVIVVQQLERTTDKLYTPKELNDFTKSFVDVIEAEGWTVHVAPKKFEGTGISNISASWLKSKMQLYGISQKQLSKDMNVDKFVISRLINERTGFTKWSKAAFWHYMEAKRLQLENVQMTIS